MIEARKRVAAIFAAVCAFALVMMLAGCSSPTASSSSSSAGASSAQAESDASSELVLNVSAAGWDETTSTPVLVRLDSEDSTDPQIFAIDANTDQTISAEAGNYTISFVSPINADGSFYQVPKAGPVTVDPAAPEDAQAYTLDLVPAGDASADQVTAVVSAISAACSDNSNINGSTEIISRAIANAEANPHADDSAIETASSNAALQVATDGVGKALDDAQSAAPTFDPENTTQSNKTYTYPTQS